MKKMVFVIALGIVSGLSAFASEQPEFVETCAPRGLEKLRDQAAAYGASLQEQTFAVCGVDDRWYNPSKYVWYCASATAQDGSITQVQKLVQYYDGQCD